MIKKLLSALICTVVCTCCVIGFVACGSHTHSYTDTVVQPTCTEKGYTKHKCSCGDEYKDNETDALGHDWGDWTQTKAPSCTEKGEKTRVCSRDSSHVETRAIDTIAHDYVDGKCSKCGATDPNYVAPLNELDAWKDSDDADDFDGDRAVTEADFAIYKAYIAWKDSATAKDYDGDGKIDYKDYALSLLGEDVATWLTSADAYDYNKDGATDKNDYTLYLERKDLVGKYVVSDFDYQIDSTEYTIQLLNSKYDIEDLKEDIGGFKFEISKDLKLTCKYSDEIKAKLGDDDAAIQTAINSCVIQKLSDNLSKATFTLDNLTFDVNLQKAENGFTSSINVKIDSVSIDVTFNLVHAN